jgi:flavin-dependent dehydrogenase
VKPEDFAGKTSQFLPLETVSTTSPNRRASDDPDRGFPLNIRTDVIVIGAGPAGIATAIAASQRGLRVIVLDARTPPIDKPCGEGLLPHGVTALSALGIHLNSDIAIPFTGIRFADEESSVCADFPDATGFAMRRVRLHQLLVERATQVGVIFLWGTRVTDMNSRSVIAGGKQIAYSWLAGADGQNSTVRRWAKLEPRHMSRKRFGFRQHFRVPYWPNIVDVYWSKHCQMLTTPTGTHEVCAVVLSRDSHLRLDQALPLFPALAERLRDATPVTEEGGEVTSLTQLPAVTRERVALVGDASGTVDAVTGQGLSLSFQQAIPLAEAFERGDLTHYESAHRRIATMPVMMSRLMLIMERNIWVRRRAFCLFQSTPSLFSKLLAIHTGALPISSVAVGEMIDLGWKLLRA